MDPDDWGDVLLLIFFFLIVVILAAVAYGAWKWVL